MISAQDAVRSANLGATTRLHNSLRTRILRTASSVPSAPVATRLKSPRVCRVRPAEPPAAAPHQSVPETLFHPEFGRRTHVSQACQSPLLPATYIPQAAAGDSAQPLPRST